MKLLKTIAPAFLFFVVSTVCTVAAPVDAKVRTVKGTVEFALPGTDDFKPLKAGTILKTGSKVRTGAGSEAVITVTPGAAMRVAENTTLELSDMAFEKDASGKVIERKANVKLDDGTVSALIDHNNPEATDFKIKTPQGSAAARGTFYGVTVKDGQSFVKVQEGKVGFQKDAEATDATAPSATPAPEAAQTAPATK